MRDMNRHRMVVLAVLGSVLHSHVVNSNADLDPNVVASGSHGAEQRITSLIHDWFAVLEGGPLESRTLDNFMAEPPFELLLIGGRVRNLAELDAWRAKLDSTHLELEYRIGSVAVEPVGDHLHRARFEFERRAVDDGGVPHIARREHLWLVRNVPDEDPVILRMDERSLLAFAGTGPQIVCY